MARRGAPGGGSNNLFRASLPHTGRAWAQPPSRIFEPPASPPAGAGKNSSFSLAVEREAKDSSDPQGIACCALTGGSSFVIGLNARLMRRTGPSRQAGEAAVTIRSVTVLSKPPGGTVLCPVIQLSAIIRRIGFRLLTFSQA
jgi:hypothetical protein